MKNTNLMVGIGVCLIALVSLVYFFGSGSTGQAITIVPNQGIVNTYSQYRALGDTVAQACLREVSERANQCCDFADVPNSDVSCIELCSSFKPDEKTCYRMCQAACKRKVSQVIGIGGETLGV